MAKPLRAESFRTVMLAVLLWSVLGIAPFSYTTASASGEWVSTGRMAGFHSGNTATRLNDGAVLVAGVSLDTGEPSAEIYRPELRTWSATASLPFPRVNHTATLLLDGRVLIAGGFQQGAGCFGCLLSDVRVFEPASGQWSPAAPMRAGRHGHSATRLDDGRVLVAGGSTSGFIAASSEIYDPATNTWSLAGVMTAQRTGHTATRLSNGTVLVAGGFGEFDVGWSPSAELFDPATSTWSRTGSMFERRQHHTATLLNDGRVLVSGGLSPRDVASAEVYDGTTASWTVVGSMGVARRIHTATLLADGRVLVAGGNNQTSGALASAEIFDPVSAGWSTVASMASPRANHTATLLSDGSVLAAGGCPFSAAWACAAFWGPDAELYIPGIVDATPPTIGVLIAPPPAANGWNNTDATVSWSVSDPESGIVSSTGCDMTTLTHDTGGMTVECSAQNGAGLSTTRSVTLKLDKTAPTIVFTSNAGTYTVDQTINIRCVASDNLSGIDTATCPGVSAPATNYVGTTATTSTTLIATASDIAGNAATASTTFLVTVTADGICRLTVALATADDICAKVVSIANAPNATARDGMLSAFDSFLGAQSGKSMTADMATLLSRFAHLL